MLDAFCRFVDRILAPLPAYMLIISGMTLLGLSLVMPAWMESREMAWQLNLMKVQAERMSEQQKNYRQFNDALATDDPVLLERLAFFHMRLKPAGTQTLTAVLPAATHRSTAPALPTIDEMLRRPVPQAGITTPAYKPLRTRLIALTTGPMRLGVILTGALCLLAGLTSPLIVHGDDQPLASANLSAPDLSPVAAVPSQPAPPLPLRDRAEDLSERLRLRLRRWGA